MPTHSLGSAQTLTYNGRFEAASEVPAPACLVALVAMTTSVVDRLTLDGGADIESHEEEIEGLPEEELLRLDDGTVLPVELAELRTLLQLHQAQHSSSDETDDPRLAAIAEAKAEAMRDLLLGFEENILLLHDKLLDHEVQCRRLDAVRRRRKAALPVARRRGGVGDHFDEACAIDDDDRDEEGALGLDDLLTLDGPGGTGVGGKGRGDLEAVGEVEGEEDEERLDQRVAASRQQIKLLLRAYTQGKTEHAAPKAHTGLNTSSAANRQGSAMVVGALPPVRPPPRAKQPSYSTRLRSQTATWSAKYEGAVAR